MRITINKTPQYFYLVNYDDINNFDYNTLNLINKYAFDITKQEFKISRAYYSIMLKYLKNITTDITIKEYNNYTPILHRSNNYILEEFQIVGVRFLIDNNLALLGDDVGLGKTIQAIFGLKNIEKENSKFLVVVPKTLIKPWQKKLEELYLNNKTEVINYEHLVTNYTKYNTLYDCIIIDEASRLRNKTLYRKALKKIKSVRYWLLSAMFIEKNPYDIYNIITTFAPNYFKYLLFDSDYSVRKSIFVGGETRSVLSGWKNLDKLKEEIKPIYLSRNREMLNMTQNNLKIDNNRIKLPETIRANVMTIIQNTDETNTLANFQKIRLYLDGITENGQLINTFKITRLRNVRGKAIVFTAYKKVAEKIYEMLYTESLLLTGDNSIQEREDTLERFKRSVNVRFLITTDILKYGMNIPEADIIVHYDLPLTYASLLQREGRNNRMDSIKQEREIVYLLTDHYFDEHVFKLILNKKDINEKVMMSSLKKLIGNE